MIGKRNKRNRVAPLNYCTWWAEWLSLGDCLHFLVSAVQHVDLAHHRLARGGPSDLNEPNKHVPNPLVSGILSTEDRTAKITIWYHSCCSVSTFIQQFEGKVRAGAELLSTYLGYDKLGRGS